MSPDATGTAASRLPSYVIAVTGTSGAGKTTLVRAVARLLGDAPTLFFDDYEATPTYPQDWTAWWRAGGDPNAVKTPRLAADLRALPPPGSSPLVASGTRRTPTPSAR